MKTFIIKGYERNTDARIQADELGYNPYPEAYEFLIKITDEKGVAGKRVVASVQKRGAFIVSEENTLV